MKSKIRAWDFQAGVSVPRANAHTWMIWSKMPRAPMDKVVALHCGLDPNRVTYADLMFGLKSGVSSADLIYNEYLALACAHVEHGTLVCIERKEDVRKSIVSLPAYAAWVESLGDQVPDQFPRSDVIANGTIERETARQQHKWPWGSHETVLLRHLAEAGEHWRLKSEGGLYDPSDRATAPKSKEIMIPWLIGRGLAGENAKVIARLLIDDNLPPGPRGRKK